MRYLIEFVLPSTAEIKFVRHARSQDPPSVPIDETNFQIDPVGKPHHLQAPLEALHTGALTMTRSIPSPRDRRTRNGGRGA
jgi:hypothetical protein